MNEKKKKTELLFEAIGEVDDELICKALEYRKKSKLNTRVVATAASLVLIFCLVAGALIMGRLAVLEEGQENKGDQVFEGSDGIYGIQAPETSITLDAVFTSLSDRDAYKYVTDPDTLPYHDGKAYIVWRYFGEERYYISAPLKDAELETIKASIGKGDQAGESSPRLNAKVWVLMGDGRVISPYLVPSNGNFSTRIFEYEVEIVPYESFAEKIQSMLS